MNITERISAKIAEQIGGLTFELLKREAECEALREENEQLKSSLKSFQVKPEKKEAK